jgi:hypothetical protein
MFLIESGPRVQGSAGAAHQITVVPPVTTAGTTGESVLLVDGYIHPDSPVTLTDVLADLRSGGTAETWARVSGVIAGVFADYATGDLLAFADNLGAREIFYWTDGKRHVVGTSLPSVLRVVPPAARRLDEQAAAQFQTMGLTILGRTFASGVRQVALGHYVRLSSAGAVTGRAWSYQLDCASQDSTEFEEAVDQGWHLIRRASDRLRTLIGPAAVLSLGLSGGLDSRLTMCAVSQAGLDVRPYFFGEPASAEASCAGLLARAENLRLSLPGSGGSFPRYFRRSLAYQPMADLEWCKYWSGRDDLTAQASAVMSGHLGDHLYGQWSVRAQWGAADDNRGLAAQLLSSCALEQPGDFIADMLTGEITAQVEEIGGSVLQRKQGFWYMAVNPSIRRCGLFSTLGAVPHFSLFEDPDVVRHGLRLPLRWRLRNRYYLRLLERHMPHLSPSAIALADGRNGHKPIERWLRGNQLFRSEAGALVDLDECYIPRSRHGRFREAVESIMAGHESRNEIHQFFRALTIRAYQSAFE